MNSSNQTSPNKDKECAGATVQEFSIRAPKNQKRRFNIMRFNSNLNMDISKWTNVKMERENNKYERIVEESPKFGAGSEYRKEEKEEARKKRLGYMGRKYNPDDQPWIMKCGGKNGKKFRGVREGGVNDNTAYYVFTHGNDGSIEAYPVGEWYNFQAVQRFKALTAEEAEAEFGKRNKSLNYFSIMMKKRFNNEGDEEADAEEGKRGKKKSGDFKISDMDDWIGSDENDSNDDDDENADSDGEAKKKKKRKPVKSQTKKKKNDDDSAQEESDDGDEEGRELDYISDSSLSDSDHEAQVDKDMKGVADEDALRKLLTSDEDSEEENEDKKKEGNSSEMDETTNNEEGKTDDKNKKKRKRSPGDTSGDGNNKSEDQASDFPKDNSDSEADKNKESTSSKSLEAVASTSEHANKRLKTEKISPPSDCGISEEAVRRYLARKPMTATELLTKFKKPKTNLSSEQLVNVMTQILKKINPVTQTIKGKMYLALNTEQKPK